MPENVKKPKFFRSRLRRSRSTFWSFSWGRAHKQSIREPVRLTLCLVFGVVQRSEWVLMPFCTISLSRNVKSPKFIARETVSHPFMGGRAQNWSICDAVRLTLLFVFFFWRCSTYGVSFNVCLHNFNNSNVKTPNSCFSRLRRAQGTDARNTFPSFYLGCTRK